MKKNHQDLNFLPNYFKKIAFGLMALSILVMIGSKLLSVQVELLKVLTKNGILISLLLIAISRDKTEDELTIKLKLKSFTASFIFGVVVIIVTPYLDLLFKGSYNLEKSSEELLFSMLFFYFIFFYIMKRSV